MAGTVKEKVYCREVALASVTFPGGLVPFNMGQLNHLLPYLITVLPRMPLQQSQGNKVCSFHQLLSLYPFAPTQIHLLI